MKILILGCGYLGKAAAQFWMERGHTVTACTRNAARLNELCQVASKVVVLPQDGWKDMLAGQDAILISVAPSPQESYRTTYFKTAEKVVQESDPITRKILYTSSTGIYGDHAGRVVTENSPAQSISLNNEILLETEKLLLAGIVPTCILRLGEIVGTGRMPWDTLRRLAGKAFLGDGSSPINLSPLVDCLNGLDFALTHDLRGIYNLCHPNHHMTRKEYYSQAAAVHALPPPLWDPSQKSPHSAPKIVSSAKLMAHGFNFSTFSF